MGVAKVTIDGENVVDLTEDTVTEDNLLEGATAHDAAGNPVTGGANLTDLSGVLPVSKGGTGKTTASDAWRALMVGGCVTLNSTNLSSEFMSQVSPGENKFLKVIRSSVHIQNVVTQNSTGIAFGISGSFGFLCPGWNYASVIIGGGVGDNILWTKYLAFKDDIKRKACNNLSLYSLNWIKSGFGKYYTEIEDFKNIGEILSVSIGTWGGIRENEIFSPYIGSDGKTVGLMSNTNSYLEGSYAAIIATYR